MKILAVVMVVTALWLVLGAVLGGCSSRRSRRDRGGAVGQAWIWESLDPQARLAQRTATVPDSHPLARLGRSLSQSA